MIHESGRNGTVEILPDRIVRTLKKRLGKDDTQTIPVRAITAVRHDRRMGRDRVKLDTTGDTYEWKVTDGEQLVAVLNDRMCGL